MKFGLLKYSRSRNFGDQVQSLAARQYLPQVDKYLDRDYLNEVDDEDQIKLILNGWFMAEPQNWPPSGSILPLLTSFHVTHDYDAAKRIFTPSSIDFFKKHEPIGCRDYFTMELMESHGIKAYYSGCLTLTLDPINFSGGASGKVYLVDILYKIGGRSHDFLGRIKRKWLIKKMIPKSILDKAEVITQILPKNTSEEEKFRIAEDALSKYAAADLVITSRIHCALPCTAFNTPVIFIDGGLEEATDTTRLKGIKEYFNHYQVSDIADSYRGFLRELFSGVKFTNPLKIDWSNLGKGPQKHLTIAEKLRKACHEFIQK